MKYISLLFLILISALAFSQNWSPIQTNEKMNYQHSDSTYISHTIWVDSASYSAGDSIFNLNRVIKDVSGNSEIVVRNQPQFLMEFIAKQGGGIYSFHYPNDYFLYTKLPVGSSWVFDFTQNIEAEIIEISVEEIFEVLDSVKLISLSDGNQIKLSKSFGIIQFPDFENGGFYELVGIQDSEYGESIPDFWDIYDFEVGDVFQYNRVAQYIWDWSNTTRKISITSKEIADSSISYTVEGIYYAYSNNGPPESYIFNDEYTFTYSENHPANNFPGQIYILPYSAMPNSDTVFTVAKIVLNSETGLVHKHFGNHEENYVSYKTDLYYEQNENNDTLLRLEYASLVGEPCGLMGIGFGETIGDLYRTEGCFEYWDLKRLDGYIKDGDTIGTITPDSLLLTTIETINSKHNKLSVYPNPASDILNVYIQNDQDNRNIVLKLRNVQGVIVLQQELFNNTQNINIESLQAGIYFYTIHQKEVILKRGKILVN